MKKIKFRINIKDNLKYLIPLLLMFFVAIGLWTSGDNNREYTAKTTQTDFYFNTVVTIDLYDEHSGKVLYDCFKICEKYENMFSRTVEDSEISKLNRREITTVSDETAELIRRGLEYSAASNGTFDITMGSVTELWDFNAEDPVVPEAAAIAEAQKHIGYEKVTLNGNEVIFSDPGTKLDLGAIAKGYVAEKIKEHLLANNVNHALINLGGNVLCVGGKTETEDFMVGIQYPYEDNDEAIVALDVKDQSVVTSGIYERFFEVGGEMYYHILDPATGYPMESDILAVSIVTADSTHADALSTTIFGMGVEKGLEFAEAAEGVEAIFIDRDYEIFCTSGLEGKLVTE